MANKIQLKRGPGAPAVGALDVGEPGFDLTNKKLYHMLFNFSIF